MNVKYLDDCKRSLISLKACGVCQGCKSRIAEVKAILEFYAKKELYTDMADEIKKSEDEKFIKGKTQKDLDN